MHFRVRCCILQKSTFQSNSLGQPYLKKTILVFLEFLFFHSLRLPPGYGMLKPLAQNDFALFPEANVQQKAYSY